MVLERGAPNRESSGTTAGNIHIQAIHPLRPGQAVPADARRFLPLQRAASSLWDTLESELDAGIELRRAGGFMVAETPEQAAHLRQKWELEAQVGIDSTLLTGVEARAVLRTSRKRYSPLPIAPKMAMPIRSRWDRPTLALHSAWVWRWSALPR